MKTYLGLCTYPVLHPVHGGQRRVTAIGRHLETLGIRYVTAAVYEPNSYGTGAVGEHDVPLGFAVSPFQELPFVGDVQAGIFAAQNDKAYNHFVGLIERLAPAAIVLEHPFMWPLVERLRADTNVRACPLIYSSHNWEAPLKAAILRKNAIAEPAVRQVHDHLVELERQVCAAASLVMAVSEHDAHHYRPLAEGKPVIVVRNGIERPTERTESGRLQEIFGDNRFFFFVGSAYPPNIDGFCELVMDGGLFFLPPEKHLLVCGGGSHGIYADPRYHNLVSANNERVHFFATIDDRELAAVKARAHAVLLPITYGGGTNLKTAEAISMGCHIIATPTALRGFDGFQSLSGLHMAADADKFRRAMIDVFHQPPLVLSAAERALRDTVYWDNCFDQMTRDILPA